MLYIYTPYNKCQHFWHFMMGEFMPIISIISRINPKHVILYNETRKWGEAYDRFYKDIEHNFLKIELVNNLEDKKYLDYINNNQLNKFDISNMKWDWKWTEKEEQECINAVRWLTLETLRYMKNSKNLFKPLNNEVIIQIRKDNLELTKYFRDANIGSIKYGYNKRSVKDLDKLINVIPKHYKTTYISMDGKHIYEQIYEHINKKKIILGHGAGMFFTLFMNNKSSILEIIPLYKIKKMNGAAQGLVRISKLKQSKLNRIILDNHKSIMLIQNINLIITNFLK
mgnify:CR=1 FL=1|tara:strand:+ start:4104 stop:4952 length:849 start_codon:yes stop_codon:yes gene_type:complete